MIITGFLSMEERGIGRRTLFSELGKDSDTSEAEASATSPLSAEEKSDMRRVMLEELAQSTAHFAHRQRDAPDLTLQEKVEIASEILDKNPAVFLSRFGVFLQSSDLRYFQDIDKDNYEVQFHLRNIQHRCSHLAVIVKNRRFAAMQELDTGGEYFSEDEMKRREPLLYEQMVGQYLTEEEQKQKMEEGVDRSDLKLSTILMKHMDDMQEKTLYKHQKDREECQEEESEESSSEEEDAEIDETENEETPEIASGRATDIWRQQLRLEFKTIMQEKFLSGNDTEFDYSKVDSNPDYDSMVAEGQDDEDRYFFVENPHSASEGVSDSEMDCGNPKAQSVMEKTAEDEEEDDYMQYVPSDELVTKSLKYKHSRSWTDSFEDT